MKILEWFSKLPVFTEVDPMPEGIMAHELRDEALRQQVQHRYNELYRPEPTPLTHPEQFDPLDPPRGYAWDPYYECWLETHDPR